MRSRRLGLLAAAALTLVLGACGVDGHTRPGPAGRAGGLRWCGTGRPGLRRPAAVLRARPATRWRIPAGSTMAEIRERGRLIAGVSADTYLLGSRNPRHGQDRGLRHRHGQGGRQGDLRRREQATSCG